jgi:bifunctional non-homologous end joining protein LigD
MLLTSGHLPRNADDGWVEPKLDGWRVTITTGHGNVVVRSRTGRRLNIDELDTMSAYGQGHIFDAELVHGLGRLDDFYPLAGAVMSRQRPRDIGVVIFDVTTIDGRTVCDETIEWRRAALVDMEVTGPNWSTVTRLPGTERDVLLDACDRLGMEGIVWKAPASRYRPGVRSTQWKKVKTHAWRADHAHRRRPR